MAQNEVKGMADAMGKQNNARRGSSSSQSSQSRFSGLINQKRNSSDATAEARRQSFHDMKPESGFIGQMWNNFTKGATSNTK